MIGSSFLFSFTSNHFTIVTLHLRDAKMLLKSQSILFYMRFPLPGMPSPNVSAYSIIQAHPEFKTPISYMIPVLTLLGSPKKPCFFCSQSMTSALMLFCRHLHKSNHISN